MKVCYWVFRQMLSGDYPCLLGFETTVYLRVVQNSHLELRPSMKEDAFRATAPYSLSRQRLGIISVSSHHPEMPLPLKIVKGKACQTPLIRFEAFLEPHLLN